MKRRILSTILILALVWLCSSTYAEEPARLWFDVTKDGEEYAISVHISGNPGIEMLQFCLRYDNEKLELKSATAGDAFLGTISPTISSNEPGQVYLVWDALKPLSEGSLLLLRFAAKENAGGNALLFFDGDYETIAANGEYSEIPLQVEKLEIAIGVPFSSPAQASAAPEITPGSGFTVTQESLAPSDASVEPEIAAKPATSSAIEPEQSVQKSVSPDADEKVASAEEKTNAVSASETKNEHALPVIVIVISLAALIAVTVTLIMTKTQRKAH